RIWVVSPSAALSLSEELHAARVNTAEPAARAARSFLAGINDTGNGNHAAGTQVGTVRESIRIHFTHVDTIDVEVADGQLSDYLCATLWEVNTHTVLCQNYAIAVDTGGDCQFFVRTQVAPFAVDRHGILRTRCVVQEEQFAAIAVTRGVNLSFLIGNNFSTDLRKHVHDAIDSFFVTWNQGGREDNHVAITNRDLTVLTTCHTRQRSH